MMISNEPGVWLGSKEENHAAHVVVETTTPDLLKGSRGSVLLLPTVEQITVTYIYIMQLPQEFQAA